MNLISDIYLFSSLSFSVCYVFKSRVCNVHRSFICIQFSFIAPVGGLCCKPKYSADNSPLYFCFCFLYFFYHSSCRKDQFTVFSLKFGFQDFTDPGLLIKEPVDPHWFVVVVMTSQMFLVALVPTSTSASITLISARLVSSRGIRCAY